MRGRGFRWLLDISARVPVAPHVKFTENGRIRRILALVNPVPYHMRSGWPATGLDP
ncbi:MAG: hypothetical protein ACRETB_02860 [Steroidobacteraceae bacterium]